jgi:hypothetical protein
MFMPCRVPLLRGYACMGFSSMIPVALQCTPVGYKSHIEAAMLCSLSGIMCYLKP